MAKCEDRRDKIYGLHSVAELRCMEAVPVDCELDFIVICSAILFHEAIHRDGSSYLVSRAETFHNSVGCTINDFKTTSDHKTIAEASEMSLLRETLHSATKEASLKCFGTLRGRITLIWSGEDDNMDANDSTGTQTFWKAIQNNFRSTHELRMSYVTAKPDIRHSLVYSLPKP